MLIFIDLLIQVLEIIELINEEINGNQFKKLEKAFDYEYNVILEKK